MGRRFGGFGVTVTDLLEREREGSKTAKIAEEKRKMRKKKKGRLMY